MKRFQLVREDNVVAEGCLFTNGKVSVAWIGDRQSCVWWDNFDDAVAVHGHAGSEFRMID